MSFFKSVGTLFSSLNFEESPFLSQLIQERVIYLFRKPWIVVHEISFEIGVKLVMEGSRPILVKLLLFQSSGCGHLQDGATPSFFPDSKSSILGLSIDVLFVLEFFLKMLETLKTLKGGQIYMEDPV